MRKDKLLALLLLPLLSCTQNHDIPGQIFNDGKDYAEMVVIPSGSFMMGAPANEPGAYPEEMPQRKVTIRQFAVSKFDKTRGQWAKFVSATHRQTTAGCAIAGKTGMIIDSSVSWRKVNFPQDNNHPVVCVTWKDAIDYVQWLSRQTGGKYRLLTESEWEYAARAGTATAYPWGPTASHDHANFGSDACCGTGRIAGRDKWLGTSPAGAFPPNAFGLYDMHGNVLQYVQDFLTPSYYGEALDGSAYQIKSKLKFTGELAFMNGTVSDAYRVCRGGDWGDPPAMIRSSSRNWAPAVGSTIANYRSSGLGFRIAKTL
ncbi:hypothetical protein A0256_14615 [Mucilaginibacter sp. PAMC 26640]|nr:hypothetical protein A0256_14615 [Mucilaginibacter sp. PAMC 26640]